MDTVFVTFIYPEALKFFEVFLSNLNNQSDRNFKLLIFNDGCNEVEIGHYLKDCQYDREIIDNNCNSLADNRMNAFKYLSKQPFNNFIFGDIDDTFAENRVEVIKEALKVHDIVFNELHLCNKDLKIIHKKLISPYLGSKSYVSLEMIKEQNLIGFSHLSINKIIIDKLSNIKCDSSVKVVDWVVMSKILKEHVAFFENRTYTNYVFHEDNLALYNGNSLENLLFLIHIKISTYLQLVELDNWYENEIKELSKIKNLIESNEDIKQRFISVYSLKKRVHYPWWAQIKNSEEMKNELCI